MPTEQYMGAFEGRERDRIIQIVKITAEYPELHITCGVDQVVEGHNRVLDVVAAESNVC